MAVDPWLRFGAIGLPLFGALIIWGWGEKFPYTQRRLTGITFGILGLIALTLFLLNRHYACVFALGRENCLFEGLATLSLFLLNVFLAGKSITLQGENRGTVYILLLLLSSSWTGIGLVENVLVLLIFLYLFFFVLNRWAKMEGFKSGFLKIRDDYDDDQK